MTTDPDNIDQTGWLIQFFLVWKASRNSSSIIWAVRDRLCLDGVVGLVETPFMAQVCLSDMQ